MSASAKPNRYLGGGKARMLLHGILPVLQVPFGSDGEIVEAELRREVTFCIAARADGMVVPALASEFMVLTDEERRRVVEIVADEAAGRVPVIAGVAAPSIQGAAAFARHARQTGAAAVMALPPYIRRHRRAFFLRSEVRRRAARAAVDRAGPPACPLPRQGG